MQSDIAIEVNNLTKIFDGTKAVNNISFKIKKGEIFGFLGPNGAGKSTTIKSILGLIHPSSGEIKINNMNIKTQDKAIKKDIGFLPERVGFYDNLTGLQNLQFYGEMKDITIGECIQKLNQFGLSNHAHKKVGKYSTGMKQRLAIARACLGNPSIIILDEPSAGLDPRGVKDVRDTIINLNKKGVTFFISSHILSEIQLTCNQVGIINNGIIVAKDSIDVLTSKLKIKPKLILTVNKTNEKILDKIKKIQGVGNINIKGNEIEVYCDSSAKSKIIVSLEKSGINILDLKTEESPLEEVFMKLTGG